MGVTLSLTLFEMGLFGAAHGEGGGDWQKRAHYLKAVTYLTMMKLGTVAVIPYLKKIQKI